LEAFACVARMQNLLLFVLAERCMERYFPRNCRTKVVWWHRLTC